MPSTESPDKLPAESSGKPRFSDIARHLREAIRIGHFPIGSVLPSELELCSHYGTSRHTIRAALLELQQLGLVSRRKNAGTRVESATPTTGFQQSLASIDDLVQFGATHSRVVQQMGEVTANAALARVLGCAEGTRWLRIASLRLQKATQPAQKEPHAPAEPIGLTEIYVSPGYAGLQARVRESPDALVSSLLEAHYGQHIHEVEQDLCAVPLPAAVARSLGVEPNAPGLRIVRQYLNTQGQVVETSVTHHPAERFSLRSRLRRAGG
ncbi:MAG: GntR family transcriptional regulator [Polaromonas sp.]